MACQRYVTYLRDFAAFTVWYLCATAASSFEGPSTRNPDALFPVGPFTYSHDVYQATVEKFEEAARQTRSLVELHGSEKQPAKGELQAVCQAQTLVSQAARLAAVLRIYCEPASVDVGLRINEISARLEAVRKAIVEDPKNIALVKSLEAKWLKQSKSLHKRIPEAERLAQQGRWHESAELLYELYDTLLPLGLCFALQTRTAGIQPIGVALEVAEPPHLKLLREEADGAIQQELTALVSEVEAAATEIESALQAAAQGNKSSLQGRELSGPELVSAAVDRFRQVQGTALKARALAWRWQAGRDRDVPEISRLETALRPLSRNIVKECCSLVEASAASVASADVPALHQSYVAALTPLWEMEIAARPTTAPKPAAGPAATSKPGEKDIRPPGAANSVASDTAATERALNALLAKAPDYAAEVQAYGRITGNILRWRERSSSAQARQRGLKDLPVGAELDRLETEMRQKLAEQNEGASRDPWRLPNPTPALLADTFSKLVERTAMADHVSSSPIDDPSAVSRYEPRRYARLSRRPDLQSLAAELRSTLWINASAPALTLETSAAVASADAGQCEQVGGVVESIGLESPATRWEYAGGDGMPLGLLPFDLRPRFFLDDYLACIELRPQWFRHRYGFVEAK